MLYSKSSESVELLSPDVDSKLSKSLKGLIILNIKLFRLLTITESSEDMRIFLS